MTLGTKADYAALKGWKKPYLSKPRIKAMLAGAMETDPADGKVKLNFEKADALFARNADPSRRLGKGPAKPAAPALPDDPNAPMTFEQAKTEQTVLKVEQERMNLAERKGETLPREGVMAASAAAGQLLREHLRSRNRRLGEELEGKSAREIALKLDAEDRMMLEMVSDDFLRRIPGSPEGGEQQRSTH